MRKEPLLLLGWLASFAVVIPACQPHTGLSEEQRLELVQEIKAFEKKLGFAETENFKTYSRETEAYHYYFYTSNTELPYSLDDPLLQFGTGTPESVSLDRTKYDVYFYSLPAQAGVKTPITKSLLRAPLYRFIRIIFHEDWHEQISLPLGLEEPSAEVVSYVAAMLFVGEKFGQDSAVYHTLRQHLTNRLRESRIYRHYYEQLDAVYSRFHAGIISEAEALRRKEELLKLLGDDLHDIWGGKPDQLNNAFIAFQMTYLRHLPLMYQVLLATDNDLTKAIAIFRSMPEQGTSFETLGKVKEIEEKVTEYLHNSLPKLAAIEGV